MKWKKEWKIKKWPCFECSNHGATYFHYLRLYAGIVNEVVTENLCPYCSYDRYWPSSDATNIPIG